jgi:hypothetical protein
MWRLHGGTGFSFSPRVVMTQLVTESKQVMVYLTGGDCGSVGITVDDGCSALSRIMLSPNGRWKLTTKVLGDEPDVPGKSNCYSGTYAKCYYADGVLCLGTGTPCYGPKASVEYKDQYKLLASIGNCIGTYWCSDCGVSLTRKELISGIDMSFWQACHEYGSKCKACSFGVGSLYEWVCA